MLAAGNFTVRRGSPWLLRASAGDCPVFQVHVTTPRRANASIGCLEGNPRCHSTYDLLDSSSLLPLRAMSPINAAAMMIRQRATEPTTRTGCFIRDELWTNVRSAAKTDEPRRVVNESSHRRPGWEPGCVRTAPMPRSRRQGQPSNRVESTPRCRRRRVHVADHRNKGQGDKFMRSSRPAFSPRWTSVRRPLARGTISTINGSCHSRELTKDTFNLPPSFPLTRSLPGV